MFQNVSAAWLNARVAILFSAEQTCNTSGCSVFNDLYVKSDSLHSMRYATDSQCRWASSGSHWVNLGHAWRRERGCSGLSSISYVFIHKFNSAALAVVQARSDSWVRRRLRNVYGHVFPYLVVNLSVQREIFIYVDAERPDAVNERQLRSGNRDAAHTPRDIASDFAGLICQSFWI